MKNVLIIEHNPSSLSPINEGIGSGSARKEYILGGNFTEFDVKNRNERIYTWGKFQPALVELNERITNMGVYGEFDHPDTFDTSLKSASHMVKEAIYDKTSNTVTGKIQLLSTSWGREAKALVDDECPLFVSSRAAGITEANGEVTLKKLFTYDIVADPGFTSARMQSLNESYGFSSDASFQIYEVGDESKINKLFEMNKDDLVTKKQLAEYSKYLVQEIVSTKKKVGKAIKQGNIEPKKMTELLGYYEAIQEDYSKLTKYLDYLAENLQIVVNENKKLKDSNKKLEKTTEKLIEHNDYLAENLEKTIEYSNYLAENVDKSIQYGEYIAEQLDKSIDYSNYIAENLDKSIEFSDYLSENLNKSIEYSEYIAENVDTNIAYSEYIAEHLDDGLAYTDYIAEQLDKSIGYSKMIAEKLNSSGSKINEESISNFHQEEEIEEFPMPGMAGLPDVEDEEGLENYDDTEDLENTDDVDVDIDELDEEDPNCRVVCDDDEDIEDEEDLEGDIIIDGEEDLDNTPDLEDGEEVDVEGTSEDELEEIVEESAEVDEDCDCNDDDCDDDCEDETDLTGQIDQLIEEAKKRKASETDEHHFLKFLNKKQIDAFYSLTNEDQEIVVAHINEESNYFSTNDVLKLINESLASKQETMEDRLIRLMPDEVQETWEKISESAKTSILSQSRLHPTSKWNDENIEHFWLTRKFPVIKESNRELIANEDNLIQEDVLSEDAFEKIMERFNKIK